MTISGDVIRVDEGMLTIEGDGDCWSISVDYFRRLNGRDPEVWESVALEFEIRDMRTGETAVFELEIREDDEEA